MDAKDHNEESSGDPPSEQITKPGKRRGRRKQESKQDQ